MVKLSNEQFVNDPLVPEESNAIKSTLKAGLSRKAARVGVLWGVFPTPLLVLLPVALVGDELGVVGVALAPDVQHLPRHVGHRVPLESPLGARVARHSLHLQLGPVG